MTTYQRLEPQPVADTVARVSERIIARFGPPPRGLGAVATELGELVSTIEDDMKDAQRRAGIRTFIANALTTVIVVGLGLALVLALRDLSSTGPGHATNWVPLLDSGVDDAVFGGLAVLFLRGLPERLERQRLLDVLHKLRSLAHVIDMHQVMKDPKRVISPYHPTDASEPEPLDVEHLHHYFAYCSELLSLVAKTSALCAESSGDSVVLENVRGIESLSSEITTRIWQKIAVLPR
jgi:hypothetical protein